MKLYSNCEGQRQKEKYCAFQLEWHKYCSAFLLDKSLPLDAIGLAESRNKDLAKKRANWIQFCENVAVSHDAGNCDDGNMCCSIRHCCDKCLSLSGKKFLESNRHLIRFPIKILMTYYIGSVVEH